MKIIVTIVGPDARQALNELLSNVQFDKLRVRITVKKESEWSKK